MLFIALQGESGSPSSFDELRRLLYELDFEERLHYGNYVYSRDDVQELLFIRPDGETVKPYQVRKVREVMVKYGLSGWEARA